jgi:hypothetical protein
VITQKASGGFEDLPKDSVSAAVFLFHTLPSAMRANYILLINVAAPLKE